MTGPWEGPNACNKLRSDQERSAPALAKARQAATGAPVMLSLELDYFGFNTRGDSKFHRPDE